MDYRRRRLSEWIWFHMALMLAGCGCALIQTQLLPVLLGARINLLLIAVIVVTMLISTPQGALLALYGGLCLDLLGYTPLGSHALALMAAVLLANLVTEQFPAENIFLVLGLVGGGTVLYHGIMFILGQFNQAWLDGIIIVIVPALVINLIIALPEFLLIRWWYERRRAW